jgi:hypothetical protein
MVSGAASMVGDVAAFFGFTRTGEEPVAKAIATVGYNNPAALEGDVLVSHS